MSERGLRPFIVPVFIPHQGCPHRCVFCEQERITSHPGRTVQRKHVERVLENAIHSKHFREQKAAEVAFYGGTFTGLPLHQMEELLSAVAPYLKDGQFRAIRVSTRPDAIDVTRLNLLNDYGVRTVELGAQSMDDEVLLKSQRGHSAEDTRQAFRRLRRHGFKVGIQLMPGLPGDTADGFRATIEEVVLMHPEMVRLYPALVIRGTALSSWYQQGKYKPLGLQEAIDICKESCTRLEEEGIRVIRMGLMSSPSLLREGQILAGPWHPAFGFLVRAAIHHEKVVADLSRKTKSSYFKIYAPQREIALIRGFKNYGLKAIEAKTGTRVVAVEADDSLPPGHIRVEGVHRFPPSTG